MTTPASWPHRLEILFYAASVQLARSPEVHRARHLAAPLWELYEQAKAERKEGEANAHG